MTDKQPEALRLADALDDSTCARLLRPTTTEAAALLRTQHKQIAAYKLLTESQEAQLSRYRAQADKFREAIATLQSEREANAILTAAIERKDALLRRALETLCCETSENMDDPGHRCGHCDDYVDRNGTLRAAIKQELSQ